MGGYWRHTTAASANYESPSRATASSRCISPSAVPATDATKASISVRHATSTAAATATTSTSCTNATAAPTLSTTISAANAAAATANQQLKLNVCEVHASFFLFRL